MFRQFLIWPLSGWIYLSEKLYKYNVIQKLKWAGHVAHMGEGGESCAQGSSGETCRKEAIGENQTQMRGQY